MNNYDFGKYEWAFGTDIEIALCGLDEEGLLKQKYNPVKLNGRRWWCAVREARVRNVENSLCWNNPVPVVTDIVDEEPDLVGEHLGQKDNHRKHRNSERYRKVRQDYAGGWGHFDLRTAKKELRRSSRRRLNNKAVFADKDAIGKHGSYFSDVEPWSVRGWRNLGGKVEVDG